MWHGQGKPSFSSFYKKIGVHDWIKTPLASRLKTKNLTRFRRSTTWRAGGRRRNFESFPTGRAMSRFDLRSKPESHGRNREVSGGLPGLLWWLNDKNRAISSGHSRQTFIKFLVSSLRITSGVFLQSWTRNFLRKTWNQRSEVWGFPRSCHI